MADYYPLIARAIAGLDPSAPGESRRALYERARAALIAQLRSVEPPLSESEITRERLSLEEAVRKVESEAAQRARDATRYGPRCRAHRARAGDAFRANTRAATRAGEAGSSQPSTSPAGRVRRVSRAASVAAQRSPAARTGRPPATSRARHAARDSRRSRCRIRSCRRPASGRARHAAAPKTAPRRRQGMRGFRDIAADADDLGRAAAQANRAARKTYANVPSPSPEFDRLEPTMENRGADAEAPYSYDESVEEAERYAAQNQHPASRSRLAPEREPKKPVRTGAAFPFKSAIAIGVVLILAGAAILWGKSALTTVSGLFKPSHHGGRSAEG